LRILALAETLDTPPVLVAHSFGAGAAVEAMMAGSTAFRGGVIVAGALGLGQDGSGQDLPLPLRPRIIREAALASTVTNPLVTKPLFQQFVFRKDSITPDIVGLLEYPFQREGTTAALAEWLPTLLIPPRNAASTDPARYAALDLPVALIWGREDTVTPPDQAEALQEALGDAPLFWMDSTGHIPQIEAPDAFHVQLAAALAQIEDN
jgi:pimeloyl-ACP methyl ester carboxylesterase